MQITGLKQTIFKMNNMKLIHVKEKMANIWVIAFLS